MKLYTYQIITDTKGRLCEICCEEIDWCLTLINTRLPTNTRIRFSNVKPDLNRKGEFRNLEELIKSLKWQEQSQKK